MNLNVLKPRQAVESAFEKPNALIAVLLVLVSSLISIVSPLAFGIQPDFIGTAPWVLLGTYIRFFVLAVLLYIVAYILKGREAVSGKIAGIVSALGLLQVPIIALLIVLMLALPAILPPFAVELAGDVQSGAVSVNDVPAWVSFLYDTNRASVNIAALYGLAAFIALIGLFNLYLLYRITSRLFHDRALPNILVMAVILIIFWLLPL